MIDTIVIESETISEELAIKIESTSFKRIGFDFSINQMIYEFTTKELQGSYDNRISIKVQRQKLVSYAENHKNLVMKVDCKPFLRIELSLHKFYLGHNIFGSSSDLDYQLSWFIIYLENVFDVDFPSYDTFKIKRIDIAKVYNLGDNIKSFFQGFNNVYYPRRRVINYDTTGLYFPGTVTTLKFYDKGDEFKKHDRRKLLKVFDKKKVDELTLLSQGILRIELEVKSRKLKELYGEFPTVKEIKIYDLEEQFNIELLRVFKIGEDNMKLYNNIEDVERVIYSNYSTRMANILIGTWHRLSIMGYDKVKSSMSETTFYRHINLLRDIGVSWNHTNIGIIENNVIDFVFNPFNTNLEIKKDLITNQIAI